MEPDEICPACEAVNCWCCNAELRDACRRLRSQRDEARAEVTRLRAVVGCEECGGRGWALNDASDPAECEACKTDRQTLGLSAPN